MADDVICKYPAWLEKKMEEFQRLRWNGGLAVLRLGMGESNEPIKGTVTPLWSPRKAEEK